VLALAAGLVVGHEVDASDLPIAVGEVLPPPASYGVDAAGIRDAAEGELREMGDPALPRRRKVVVSLALTRAAVDPVACTVNAMVRDARTGAMIVIIEANSHSDASSSQAVREQVAHAAVRSAVRKIPRALGGR
jgi:hypothetical protein